MFGNIIIFAMLKLNPMHNNANKSKQKQPLDNLFTKLQNHQTLTNFGLQPIEAFKTVFGPDIAERTAETIAEIEKEIREAGYDVKIQ
jgi:hypothetical protein